MAWERIKTAPRDGSEILTLWWTGSGWAEPQLTRWEDGCWDVYLSGSNVLYWAPIGETASMPSQPTQRMIRKAFEEKRGNENHPANELERAWKGIM